MQSINFSLLKTEEVHTFALRFLPIIELITQDEPLLKVLYPRLQDRINDLSLALGLSRTSKFTDQLFAADEKRDKFFMGFKNLVTCFTFHPDPAISQAGRVLELLIQKRGTTLYSFGYVEETSQLNGLLEDLKNPEAQQAIAVINAGFWTDALEKSQHEFEAIYQQKVATEAVQDLPKITDTRRDIVHMLTRMLQYVEAHAEINGEKFNPIVEKIDEVIVDMMTIARTRKTRKEDNKENQPQ